MRAGRELDGGGKSRGDDPLTRPRRDGPAKAAARDTRDNVPAGMAPGFEQCRAAVDRVLSKPLFFIGGLPKSGTTWLQLLLDAHPDICCRGEGHLANRFGPLLRGAIKEHNATLAVKNTSLFKGLPAFPEFTGAHLKYLWVSAAALLLADASTGREATIGEKTPDNVLHFALLAELLPHAKFVHVIRDPRDCAVSGWFHNQRSNPGEARHRFGTLSDYLRMTAERWTTVVAVAAEFAEAHPASSFEVRYEDLVAQPRETLGGLLRFLGVAATPRLIDACRAEAAFEKLSGGRQRGEEDRASFFRRGQAGDWRNHVSAEENAAFLALYGPIMARHGYS